METEDRPEPVIPDIDVQGVRFLALIEQHLKSIRSMLTFFTVLTILAFVLSACNILLSL